MKKRSRRQNKSSSLNFQRLEPRQMLAGDAAAPHQVADSLPTGANLVVNGDFETFTSGADNFYNQSEVDGWSAKDAATTNQELNIIPYQGYGNVLDLDSTGSDFDRVFQDIDTEAGAEYLITFDFRSHTTPDPDATENTHDFEVWWGGTRVGQYSPTDRWQTGTITVEAGSGGLTELLFCELEEGPQLRGDSRGALLDNIRVVKANGVNLTNGGFETTAEVSNQFFKPWEVDGWAAMGADVNDRFLKIIHNDDTDNDTNEGNQYLNLDSRQDFRDVVYRDLDTTAGATYYVTFDARTDGVQADGTRDDFRVRWNGEWAATIRGTGDWQNYGLVLTADSDTTRFTFLEPDNGDGSGPLIDNVRIFEVRGDNELSIDLNGTDSDGTAGQATFIPGLGSQPIATEAVLDNADGTLSSVTISLSGVEDGTSELLAIAESAIPTDSTTGQPVISVTSYSSSTQQLLLSGTASVADYQSVLRTLSYFNASSSPTAGDRNVEIIVGDTDLPVGSQTKAASITVAYESDQAAIDDAILQKYAADNNLTIQEITTGLYAVIDEPGSGLNPTINDTVRVKYSGFLLELNDQNELVQGTTFDASSEDGVSFPLSRVIVGWQEGIPAFKTGGIGKLLIPSIKGYGIAGNPPSIPGNSVLVFDVELKEIL